jgi:hypothetical protein
MGARARARKRGRHDLSYPDSSCPGINGDPLLAALGPNGGPTDTMLPASGSAAIGVIPAASCSATDQRGNLRLPSGDTVCDIGAVETGLAAPQLQLSVLKSGTGGGTVTSSPTGINCGATCAANYTTGQLVTLTATPAAGSTFSGWSGGGCGGTGQCAVTLNANTQVTATFTPSSTSPGGGGGPPAAPPGPTGQRAAAVKKCKKKKGRARTNCLKKAKKLPV